MKQPRHIYTAAHGELRRVRDYFSRTREFVVIHEHPQSVECSGDCRMMNAPNEDEGEE